MPLGKATDRRPDKVETEMSEKRFNQIEDRLSALGTLAFTSQSKTWGPTPPIVPADRIDINATNVSSVTIDPKRAGVTCNVDLRVTSDGPIDINLAGCK